jgi:hypothetical protein
MIKTKNISWFQLFTKVTFPVLSVLFLAILLMGYYNYRVTKNFFRMPYQVHESHYGIAPIFIWQPLKPEPPYNHQCLKDFYTGWSIDIYKYQQSFWGWLTMSCGKISSLWMFFLGITFTPFIFGLLHSLHRDRVKFSLGICGLVIAALLLETWFSPHYAAPITCILILLMVESCRQVRLARWNGRPVGKVVVAAIIPILFLSAITSFLVGKHLTQLGWNLERARILRELDRSNEKHLILVCYGKKHSPHQQWIYNRADIDNAKVIWASERGFEQDKELIDYYQKRRIWLLKADDIPRRLIPYSSKSE